MSIIPSLAVCDSECLSRSGRLQPARISGRDVIRISGKGVIRISGTRSGDQAACTGSGRGRRSEGRVVEPQVTEVTTTLLPQAEVALIEGTNHMLPLQDPDALGEALARFVRRHPIGALV